MQDFMQQLWGHADERGKHHRERRLVLVLSLLLYFCVHFTPACAGLGNVAILNSQGFHLEAVAGLVGIGYWWVFFFRCRVLHIFALMFRFSIYTPVSLKHGFQLLLTDSCPRTIESPPDMSSASHFVHSVRLLKLGAARLSVRCVYMCFVCSHNACMHMHCVLGRRLILLGKSKTRMCAYECACVHKCMCVPPLIAHVFINAYVCL